MSLSFEFEYRGEDERYRVQRVTRRSGDPSGYLKSGYGIFNLCLAVPFALLMTYRKIDVLPLVLLVIIVTYALRNMWSFSKVYGDTDSPIFGKKRCLADEQGIAVESDHLKQWLSWKSVRDVEENKSYLLIFYDRVRSIAIPKISFGSEEQLKEFTAFIRSHIPVTAKVQSPYAKDITALRLLTLFTLFLLVVMLLYASRWLFHPEG